MADGNADDQPWEGGVSVPIPPPHVPEFDSAAIIVAQQSDVYLDPEPSRRYVSAVFGAIAESAPGQLSGTVSYPDGVAGTIVGSATAVTAKSYLAPLPQGFLAPLRTGDLRSLILSLEKALTAGDLDPLWQHMLAFAQQADA